MSASCLIHFCLNNSSEIFCSGDVLHTIQMAKIFNDSKTFVDMKLKRPPNETVQQFREFMSQHGDNPSKDDVKQFVGVSMRMGCLQSSWRAFGRRVASNGEKIRMFGNTETLKTLLFFFLQTNFEKRGTEFDDWLPPDWIESPKYLSNIKDVNFREFGVELNKLWKILGRKMKDDVAVSAS